MAETPELPRTLLDELYADGVAYDAARADRLQRRRNLEPDAAELLWVMLQAANVRTMVEIGTSNGYSAIWFAAALRRTGGRLVSVDIDPAVQAEARANLVRAGLDDVVELRTADGGVALRELADESVDALFLDAERVQYASWWPDPVRVLRPGGLLIVDNVLSHPDEVVEISARIAEDSSLRSTVVAVGKGELIAVKAG